MSIAPYAMAPKMVVEARAILIVWDMDNWWERDEQELVGIVVKTLGGQISANAARDLLRELCAASGVRLSKKVGALDHTPVIKKCFERLPEWDFHNFGALTMAVRMDERMQEERFAMSKMDLGDPSSLKDDHVRFWAEYGTLDGAPAIRIMGSRYGTTIVCAEGPRYAAVWR